MKHSITKEDIRATIQLPKSAPVTFHHDLRGVGFIVFKYLQTNPSYEDMNEVAQWFADLMLRRKDLGVPPSAKLVHTKASWVRSMFNVQPGGIFNVSNVIDGNIDEDKWSNSFQFTRLLMDHLIRMSQYPAAALVCETAAHRYGDLFINDESKCDEMLARYHRSIDLARHEVSDELQHLVVPMGHHGNQKQLVTPFFWAAEYLFVMRHIEKYHTLSASYFKQYIEQVAKVPTRGFIGGGQRVFRAGYSYVTVAIAKIRHLLSEDEWEKWFAEASKYEVKYVKMSTTFIHQVLYGWPDRDKVYMTGGFEPLGA